MNLDDNNADSNALIEFIKNFLHISFQLFETDNEKKKKKRFLMKKIT